MGRVLQGSFGGSFGVCEIWRCRKSPWWIQSSSHMMVYIYLQANWLESLGAHFINASARKIITSWSCVADPKIVAIDEYSLWVFLLMPNFSPRRWTCLESRVIDHLWLPYRGMHPLAELILVRRLRMELTFVYGAWPLKRHSKMIDEMINTGGLGATSGVCSICGLCCLEWAAEQLYRWVKPLFNPS